MIELGEEAKERGDLDMKVWKILVSKLPDMGDEEGDHLLSTEEMG